MIIVKDYCYYDTEDNPFLEEFGKLPSNEHIRLGILMNKSVSAAFIVDICYRKKYTFVFLPQKPLKHCFEMVEKFQITHIVSEGVGDGLGKSNHQFHWDGKMYYFYFINSNLQQEFFKLFGDDWIAYGVRTSGTTGEPKVVYVPYSSILYNIKSFSKQFENEPEPTILWSSGVSFDTSSLELLLALSSDGRLVIPPEDFDNPFGEFDLHKLPTIDFYQTTPTKLLTSNESKLAFIFDSQKVKRLYIGGEHFPLKFISQRKHDVYPEVWNLYGLTEISCWSTIFGPLTSFDLKNRRQISIGSNLYGHETEVKDGQIIVNGPPTIISGLLRFVPYVPGDAAIVEENTSEIYIIERGVLKPYGIRFSSEAEEVIRNSGLFPEFIDVRSIVIAGCPILLLITEDKTKNIQTIPDIEKLLNERLPRNEIPTLIYLINRNEIHVDLSGLCFAITVSLDYYEN